jgi:nucleoside 2-deoxyribosyltransferase
MQFGAPYDALYQEVIQPVSHRAGFKALRADDVYRPGVILQDIIRGIIESDVIVADITPTIPNVFYELGYAHALQKPTILLANRQIEKLPFDVSGYRGALHQKCFLTMHFVCKMELFGLEKPLK